MFPYLTNISFFHCLGGNTEHNITSFRNHLILLANGKSHCSAWEVRASGPRQWGSLEQVQERVSKDYQTLGVITQLISLRTNSISAHRLLTNPSKFFILASLSLHQPLLPSSLPCPHLCAPFLTFSL